MKKVLSDTSLRCTSCDKLRKGVSFIFTGEFLCMECLMKRKAEQLDNDPEWIKKEKVWKLRQARNRYNERMK